jgi:hypothetical protein
MTMEMLVLIGMLGLFSAPSRFEAIVRDIKVSISPLRYLVACLILSLVDSSPLRIHKLYNRQRLDKFFESKFCCPLQR